MKSKYTPWYTANGTLVCTEDDSIIAACRGTFGNASANARFITQACNSHAELLNTIKLLIAKTVSEREIGRRRAREVIAKVEGR